VPAGQLGQPDVRLILVQDPILHLLEKRQGFGLVRLVPFPMPGEEDVHGVEHGGVVLHAPEAFRVAQTVRPATGNQQDRQGDHYHPHCSHSLQPTPRFDRPAGHDLPITIDFPAGDGNVGNPQNFWQFATRGRDAVPGTLDNTSFLAITWAIYLTVDDVIITFSATPVPAQTGTSALVLGYRRSRWARHASPHRSCSA
jgi:hypothetical protein